MRLLSHFPIVFRPFLFFLRLPCRSSLNSWSWTWLPADYRTDEGLPFNSSFIRLLWKFCSIVGTWKFICMTTWSHKGRTGGLDMDAACAFSLKSLGLSARLLEHVLVNKTLISALHFIYNSFFQLVWCWWSFKESCRKASWACCGFLRNWRHFAHCLCFRSVRINFSVLIIFEPWTVYSRLQDHSLSLGVGAHRHESCSN